MPRRSPTSRKRSPTSRKRSPTSRKRSRHAKASPRVKKASPTARPPTRGGCVRQTSPKYRDRPSPPFPANECRGQIKEGNNGKPYESLLKGKIWRWMPLK